jgi:tRNA pseudouridine65 synthase
LEDVEIIYQDEHFVAVCKPSGMPVHHSREHRDAGQPLLQTVRDRCGKRVYPVHRLDRPVSGVLVMAFSSSGARALQESLGSTRTMKRYLTLVRGVAPEYGTIQRPLTHKESGRKQAAHTAFDRRAVYSSGPDFGPLSLLEVWIRTGRRHQIRRHLSHLGHHVLGDTTYGKGRINRYMRQTHGLSRIFLHAWRLELDHPHEGKKCLLEAPLPEGLTAVLERLEGLDPEALGSD